MAIKNISWNFVGWVDLEDVGFEGVPIDDRLHTDEFLASAYGTAAELAIAMDKLGYDALYSTEHHFQPEGIEVFSNLQLLFVHLASLTQNLRFGCAFNIVPEWHPLRLAEDYATADILTGGRVIFGVGRGTQTRELETLGAPMIDQEKNLALFREQVEIILAAFNEQEFAYHGKFYDIPPPVRYREHILDAVSLVPRPLYSREIWQPITSGRPEGVEFQARNGIKGVLAKLNLDAVDPVVQMYMNFAEEAGRTLALGEDLGAYLYCHIADSREEAAREVERFQEESFKRTAGIGGNPTEARLTHERDSFALDQLQRLGTPGTARETAREMGYKSLEERSAADRTYLFGPAESIIDTLKEIEEKYPGLETIILHPPELTHRHIMLEQVQRFAAEVMPAFPDAIKRDRTWPNALADANSAVRYRDDAPVLRTRDLADR